MVRRRRVVTRRDRDLRLGYAGLLVGAGAFVGALVVTTTVVDVLPDLGGERPVLAAEQSMVPGAQLRPGAGVGTRPDRAGDTVGRTASPPSAAEPQRSTQPSQSSGQPVVQPVVQPAAAPAQPASPPSGQGPRGPQGPQGPQGPPPTSPAPPSGGGGDGPVSAVLNPAAGTAAQALDELTGGLSQPVGQGVVGVVGTLGAAADGPLGGGATTSPGKAPQVKVKGFSGKAPQAKAKAKIKVKVKGFPGKSHQAKGSRGKGSRGKGPRLSAGKPWR